MRRFLKNSILISFGLLFMIFFFQNSDLPVQDSTSSKSIFKADPEEFPFFEENEKCMSCHGETYYILSDPETGVEKKRMMTSHYIFERKDFYNSNHKSFACLDCHAYEFENFPHPVSARLEEPYACLDCHGYDDNYAQFHFEEIEDEYLRSTHAEIEGFSCWKCHNAHIYKINIRNSTNLLQTIQFDNGICLECHGKTENFILLSDKDKIDLVEKHDWLPNQIAHFSSVRCIECHTKINDSILVAHDLRPVDEAVKNCTDCHSASSRLMSTLYKFQSRENRKNGFVNAVILNESYVIGANRNIYLNIASVGLFGLVLLSISIHIFFRVINRNKINDD